MPFSTFGDVSLRSERIVSDVGKSHITVAKANLPALNILSNIEVFVGRSGERKDSRYVPFTHRSFVCVTSIPRLSIVYKTVQ